MDPEIKAMADITEALDGLESETTKRVLRWAMARYNASAPLEVSDDEGEVGPLPSEQGFADFHDLYDAANPQTGLDRILVTGYWFQELEGHAQLDSFQINKELKNLGHGSGNITRDLQRLIDRRPRLVLQVRKEGTTKQARKKYRLSREGILAVQRMLEGRGDE